MSANKKTFIWVDLPEPKNLFTVRSAVMKDLQDGEIISYYSTNTKISLAQKCVTENGAFYRTNSAKVKSLDWAFEASAFGLPNEFAPPAPSSTAKLLKSDSPRKRISLPLNKKRTKTNIPKSSNGGEKAREKKENKLNLFNRIFRKK